jgi:GT2 family glycosyltransferase
MGQIDGRIAAAISVVIPLYNQLEYTRGCLESLWRTTSADVELILVDNASSDGTVGYLQTVPGLVLIANRENRGFAGACNQGIISASGQWIVVMNNDVILSNGWLQGLLSAAAEHQLDMVSPAIREGDLNYDLESYAEELTSRMKPVVRSGTVNGICFMARRRVFETIGVFDENFRIGQYEDKDLFLRARRAGFRLGTVGAAFIHHFGSITQKAVGARRETRDYALANKAYFSRKWQLPWWKRLSERTWNRLKNRLHSLREKRRYGHTLLEKWIDGRLMYE